MQIFNLTEMDAQTMRRFAAFQMNGKRTKKRILNVFVLLLCGFSLLLTLSSAILLEDFELLVYGGVLLLMMMLWFALASLTKRRLEKNYSLRGISAVRYVFEDDGFCAEVVSSGAQITDRVGYAALKRAVETKDDFYLHMGMRGWYIVSKNGFDEEGALCDMRILFSSLLGTKFKILS